MPARHAGSSLNCRAKTMQRLPIDRGHSVALDDEIYRLNVAGVGVYSWRFLNPNRELVGFQKGNEQVRRLLRLVSVPAATNDQCTLARVFSHWSVLRIPDFSREPRLHLHTSSLTA